MIIVQAQKVFTLKDCINIALVNNQQVTDAVYQNNINKISLQQAQLLRLPTVNINLNQGLNTGRSIDPFSNQYIDQTIQFGNYGASLDVTLFNGMQLNNTIKRNRATMQAGALQTAATKNALTLNVIRSYLMVISSNEIIVAVKLQLKLTQDQLKLAQKKVEAGVFAVAELADLNTQIATEELSVSTAQNSFELAKLDLFLDMNYESEDTITFVPEAPAAELLMDTLTVNEVYEAALKNLPDVQTIQQQKMAAQFDKWVAKSSRYPTLSFFASSGSTYSSSVNKMRFIPDGTTTSVTQTSADNFVAIAGSNYYTQQKTMVQNGRYQPFTYINQLGANINYAVGFSLRIPILNGMQTKVHIATANAALSRINGQLNTSKNQLKNVVAHAVQNLKNAELRISLIQKQVNALQQTLSYDSLKMDNGTLNITDYVVAKSNYDQAKINFVEAKYQYRLLQIIVQFYQKGRWD